MPPSPRSELSRAPLPLLLAASPHLRLVTLPHAPVRPNVSLHVPVRACSRPYPRPLLPSPVFSQRCCSALLPPPVVAASTCRRCCHYRPLPPAHGRLCPARSAAPASAACCCQPSIGHMNFLRLQVSKKTAIRDFVNLTMGDTQEELRRGVARQGVGRWRGSAGIYMKRENAGSWNSGLEKEQILETYSAQLQKS
ncbi:hypothetical protein ZWY2020_003847 [Hordeum vulgare]|nr:hypothetical protein ZWY2020_003847 [Hordeum vulgare]